MVGPPGDPAFLGMGGVPGTRVRSVNKTSLTNSI